MIEILFSLLLRFCIGWYRYWFYLLLSFIEFDFGYIDIVIVMVYEGRDYGEKGFGGGGYDGFMLLRVWGWCKLLFYCCDFKFCLWFFLFLIYFDILIILIIKMICKK